MGLATTNGKKFNGFQIFHCIRTCSGKKKNRNKNTQPTYDREQHDKANEKKVSRKFLPLLYNWNKKKSENQNCFFFLSQTQFLILLFLLKFLWECTSLSLSLWLSPVLCVCFFGLIIMLFGLVLLFFFFTKGWYLYVRISVLPRLNKNKSLSWRNSLRTGMWNRSSRMRQVKKKLMLFECVCVCYFERQGNYLFFENEKQKTRSKFKCWSLRAKIKKMQFVFFSYCFEFWAGINWQLKSHVCMG